MSRNNLFVLGAFFVVSACAVSRLDPLSIPLAYKPNPKNAGVLGGLPCNAVSQVQVSDARVEKALGVRTHESKPLKANVTITGDSGHSNSQRTPHCCDESIGGTCADGRSLPFQRCKFLLHCGRNESRIGLLNHRHTRSCLSGHRYRVDSRDL